MRNLVFVFFISIFCFSACKKEEGCTDPNAQNYDSNADTDDGSCIYYSDLAQGIWYFDTDSCANTPIDFDDVLPDSININNDGNNVLSLTIESPLGESVTVFGDIDNNGNLEITEQELFSIDTAFAGIPVSVPVTVSGNGQIISGNSGQIQLTYKAGLTNIFEIFNFTCYVSLFRNSGSGFSEYENE